MRNPGSAAYSEQASHERGLALAEAGRHEEALACVREHLLREPADGEALNDALGRAAMQPRPRRAPGASRGSSSYLLANLHARQVTLGSYRINMLV